MDNEVLNEILAAIKKQGEDIRADVATLREEFREFKGVVMYEFDQLKAKEKRVEQILESQHKILDSQRHILDTLSIRSIQQESELKRIK